MEIAINCSTNEKNIDEFIDFINEGLDDLYNNELFEAEAVFNELEKRYDAYE